MVSNKCTVMGCKDSAKRKYMFPRHLEDLKIWVERTGNPMFKDLSAEAIRKFKICRNHFDERCDSPGTNLKLKYHSLPTLNLPQVYELPLEYSSRKPQTVGHLPSLGKNIGSIKDVQDKSIPKGIPIKRTNLESELIVNNDENLEESKDVTTIITFKKPKIDGCYCVSQMEPEIENVSSASTFEPIMVEKSEIDSTGKKLQKKSEILINILNKKNEERNHLIQEMTKTESVDMFFKNMALIVKDFSPELKIRAQIDILKIITELKLQNFKSSVQNSTSNYVFPENLTSKPQALVPINYPSCSTHSPELDGSSSESK